MADRKTWKSVGRKIGGWILVLVGLVGFVLPIIPGIPMLLGGLALLSVEYTWARLALGKLKAWIARLRRPRAETS